MRTLRALKLFAFASMVLVAVLLADLAQAVGETLLVPQEDRMHALVNDTRAQAGRPALANNDALRWMARRQAQTMAMNGYIHHTPDLAAEANASALPWRSLGENVGKGPSTEDIFRAFLASPTHRDNVTHDGFNTLGVGATADAEAALYFTQSFAALEAPTPAPTAPAPSEPAPSEPAPSTPAPSTPAPATPPATEEPRPVAEDTAEGTTTTAEPRPDAAPAPATSAVRPPERPSFWRLVSAMLGRFMTKLTFWR